MRWRANRMPGPDSLISKTFLIVTKFIIVRFYKNPSTNLIKHNLAKAQTLARFYNYP